MHMVMAFLVGCMMGLSSGLLGIGGGAVAVPAMIYLMGMSTHLAMGTSLAVIIPLAVSGTCKHWINRNVDLRVAIALALGGIVCAYAGAWLQPKVPAATLRRIFGAMIVLVGLNMVLSRSGPREDASRQARLLAAGAETTR